jgi:hypothetical protein
MMRQGSDGSVDCDATFAEKLYRLMNAKILLTYSPSLRGPLLACLIFVINLLELSPHDGGVSIDSGPILDADNTLINQHAEPIHSRATACFGIFDEMGTRWVWYDVRYYHARLERLNVDVEPVMNRG